MPIAFHPEPGTILICDFQGLRTPEIIKRRPVIVISPRLRHRDSLCTVVPLSTTAPQQICPYHCQIETRPPLPHPYTSQWHWVKGDMLYTVGYMRLFMPVLGKDQSGKRIHDIRVLDGEDFDMVMDCVKFALGLN